jgi:hypothetical protein
MARAKKTRRQRLALLRSRWLGTAAGVALWAGGGALGSQAVGQTPALPPAHSEPAQFHLNRQTIQLPIQLDEQFRPILQEIRLYYKERLTAPWTLRDKATPAQTSFTFRAPHDGEYWFMMVTVDREGRCAPQDIAKEPPAMAIIVDTQPPQAEVRRLSDGPDGQLIEALVRDAHLDPSKTRVQYQTADRVYRELEPVSDRPGVYCIPAQANTTGMIRVFGSDQAGNTATRECNLSQLVAGKTPTPAVTQVAATVPAANDTKVVGPQLQLPPAGENLPVKAGVPMTMPAAEKVTTVTAVREKPATPNPLPAGLDASPTLAPTTVGTVPQGPPVKSAVAETPIQKTSASEPKAAPTVCPKECTQHTAQHTVPQTTASPKHPATPARPATIAAKQAGMPLHHLLVNSTHVFLEYRIEQAGASGVGKVEVWCTRDKGQSWQRIGEDRDRKSPAEVQLASDGVYGLTLVVSNGLGFGARAPVPGDAPDWWIEVDTTQPTAQITTVRLSNEDGPAVHIGWTSKDRNLGSGPVDLSYAIERNGPWLPIAKGLKGAGQHRWTPPLDIGKQAFFRVTVRDLAGNTTITETTQPVALDDLSRPRAVMTGISTDTATTPTVAPKNDDN